MPPTRQHLPVFRSRQIIHLCPYKGHDVHLALCYIRSQDVAERDYCYACPHVDTLKERYGLRTFKRRLVSGSCLHCGEAASCHDVETLKCSRIPACPSYEVIEDEGTLYVPTRLDCTEWMLVDVATGRRTPMAARDKRFQVPLLGAPGTVPNDARDDERNEAATFAERKRGFARTKTTDEPTAKKPTTRRRKKTP